ncbi:MAG: hypothetical protein WB902_10730 [Acetobacteraceae bacterium]|jgi:hypothetical protein
MASSPQIQLQPASTVPTAAGNQPNLLQALQSALAGGTPVYNFFSKYHQTLQTFYQTMATGDDTIWLDGTDQSGNPVKYVTVGNNYLTLSANITDTGPLVNGTGSDPKLVGVATVTVSIDNLGTHICAIHDVLYTGMALGGAGILVPFVGGALKAYRFYTSGLAKRAAIYVDDDGLQPSGTASEDGATIDGQAAADSQITDISPYLPTLEIEVSTAEVVGAVGGAAIVFIMVLLQIMLVEARDYVQFYNVTSQDIKFGIGYLWRNISCNGPAPVGQTATIKAVQSPPTVPGIIPSDTVINYALITFDNSGSGESIGYVLEATPSGDFPGFRVAVYVGGDGGDTSLYLAFTNDDCNDFWQQFDDDPGTGQETLTMQATYGKYTLAIALNQLDGQSPSPLDGTMGYNFEHLIVLTDSSIPLS